MPKTAVHEYCNAMLLKYKIWIPKQSKVATPASDVECPKHFNKGVFSCFISSSEHSRHDLGALRFSEYVCHYFGNTLVNSGAGKLVRSGSSFLHIRFTASASIPTSPRASCRRKTRVFRLSRSMIASSPCFRVPFQTTLR